MFPDWSQTILSSGITLGSVTAIVLNAFFNGKDGIVEEDTTNNIDTKKCVDVA